MSSHVMHQMWMRRVQISYVDESFPLISKGFVIIVIKTFTSFCVKFRSYAVRFFMLHSHFSKFVALPSNNNLSTN